MSVTIIYVNGTKVYRVRQTNPSTGKREEHRFSRKLDAERADRAMGERFTGMKKPLPGQQGHLPRYTIKALNSFRIVAQDYIDQSRFGRDGKRPLELNTLANYQSYIDRFFEEVFGDITVEDMTKQDVRSAIVHLRKVTSSTDMARRVYRFAKSVMKWAVESLELRDSSPMTGLDIETDKGDRARLPKTHTSDEIDRMVAVAYRKFTSAHGKTRKAWQDYYPIFMLLATTGMRSSECFALTWERLNETMTVAHIDKRVIRNVKGVTKDNRVGPPKSSFSYRDVPIPEQVAMLLRARRSVSTTSWVFADGAGGPKNYRAVREFMWKPLIKDAGVRELGMHALRHYAASLVIKEMGALVVREILGHHSAAFTMKTYGGFIDDKAKVMTSVGDMFNARMSAALTQQGKHPESKAS